MPTRSPFDRSAPIKGRTRPPGAMGDIREVAWSFPDYVTGKTLNDAGPSPAWIPPSGPRIHIVEFGWAWVSIWNAYVEMPWTVWVNKFDGEYILAEGNLGNGSWPEDLGRRIPADLYVEPESEHGPTRISISVYAPDTSGVGGENANLGRNLTFFMRYV